LIKKISIAGSTGSIGKQALEVVARFPEHFSIVGLAAYSDWETLAEQAEAFHPKEVAIADESSFLRLSERLSGKSIKLWKGVDGLARIAEIEEAETVLVSVVGMAGLAPTLRALEAGKTVALATKEALVAGGNMVMYLSRVRGLPILPVDSEHSAIFQCLQGHDRSSVKRLMLTSSGGPFRGFTADRLKEVTVAQALNHPTWKMGSKVTIDSATLMNKGLEVIEAHHLFSMPLDKIDVIIHRESIIHSLVEFCDGSTLAQLSSPDMRLPIQYALGYPQRLPRNWKPLCLEEVGALTFERPDRSLFRCLDLACSAASIGRTMPTVLNAANEIAVEHFLSGAITFLQIADLIEKTMEAHTPFSELSLSTIMEADRWAREYSTSLVNCVK
jgi:1-deoxy-D-xylulose-5-phosphate reductoisomerase